MSTLRAPAVLSADRPVTARIYVEGHYYADYRWPTPETLEMEISWWINGVGFVVAMVQRRPGLPAFYFATAREFQQLSAALNDWCPGAITPPEFENA